MDRQVCAAHCQWGCGQQAARGADGTYFFSPKFNPLYPSLYPQSLYPSSLLSFGPTCAATQLQGCCDDSSKLDNLAVEVCASVRIVLLFNNTFTFILFWSALGPLQPALHLYSSIRYSWTASCQLRRPSSRRSCGGWSWTKRRRLMLLADACHVSCERLPIARVCANCNRSADLRLSASS